MIDLLLRHIFIHPSCLIYPTCSWLTMPGGSGIEHEFAAAIEQKQQQQLQLRVSSVVSTQQPFAVATS